jgi:vacuolar-type H+-ATPase subunit I/STV1
MIVRVAELSLVVRDTEEAVAEIKGIVGGLGGYIVDIQLWRDSDQLRGTVMVRVPAESLEDALTEFKSLAVKVQRETGSSRDVTEEYSDLEAQLRNLEATEKELRELLATVRERTGKAEDILAVYRELTSIRGQIEQLTGRMQYLERTAAMSAVSIELIPDVLARPIASTGWRPSETASAAVRALVNTLRVLAGAAIWVALYVLPIAALVAIPLVALWLLWRRRRRGRLPVSDQSQ